MTFLRHICCLAWIAGALGVSPVPAQDLPLPAEHHPWGRFPVGSWKDVRVISETLDENGSVTNITMTDTKTTLVAIDAKGFTLRVQVTVEVAGKRFASQPQLTRHGFYGESASEPISVKKTGEGEVSLNGTKVPCELRQVTLQTEMLSRLSTLYYSAEVFPYVLRRETTTTEGAEAKSTATLVEIVATGLPQKVLGDIKPGAYVKTVRKSSQASAITLEVQCYDVPGGVISHSAQELDERGRTVRRSTLELVDYSIGIGRTDESPLIRRRKYHRRQR